LSGGAPLSLELQGFMRAVLCCPIQQAYGMTEICGATVVTEFNDRSTDGIFQHASRYDL
jgi:long-subunit acyl-CoA synthetase (AMP-forming)